MGKDEQNKELCGRCAMSSVSGMMEEDHDPFGEERIEVEESELRKVSPAVVLGKVKHRLDEFMTELTYGR